MIPSDPPAIDARPRLRLTADPAAPTATATAAGAPPERVLDGSACRSDDEELRGCPACSCPALFVRKRGLEVITSVSVAAGLAAAWAGGLLTLPQVAAGLVVVLVAGLAAALLRGPMPASAGPVLCCYACDARFGGAAPTHAQRCWSAELAAAYRSWSATRRKTPHDLPANDVVVHPRRRAADRAPATQETDTVRGAPEPLRRAA